MTWIFIMIILMESTINKSLNTITKIRPKTRSWRVFLPILNSSIRRKKGTFWQLKMKRIKNKKIKIRQRNSRKSWTPNNLRVNSWSMNFWMKILKIISSSLISSAKLNRKTDMKIKWSKIRWGISGQTIVKKKMKFNCSTKINVSNRLSKM